MFKEFLTALKNKVFETFSGFLILVATLVMGSVSGVELWFQGQNFLDWLYFTGSVFVFLTFFFGHTNSK